MARRTQVAVLMVQKLNHPEDPASGYRLGPFPDLLPGVTAALLECTSEARAGPPAEAERAGDALRLADALAPTRTGPTGRRLLPSQT